jgi:hypothetical protein
MNEVHSNKRELACAQEKKDGIPRGAKTIAMRSAGIEKERIVNRQSKIRQHARARRITSLKDEPKD